MNSVQCSPNQFDVLRDANLSFRHVHYRPILYQYYMNFVNLKDVTWIRIYDISLIGHWKLL